MNVPTADQLFNRVVQQRDAALQIIAALILTPEEGESMVRYGVGPSPAWISSMRQALLSPSWRPQLVGILEKYGFLTNTHPGFPFAPFDMPPAVVWDGPRAYAKLKQLLANYENGEGPTIPSEVSPDEYWKSQLLTHGVAPEVADWILTDGGGLVLVYGAKMARSSRTRSAP
jgi:hypothetical protein